MLFALRPGIRTKIVFTLAALMAGTMALIGVLFLMIEERNLLAHKIRAGRQMMAGLQQFVTGGPEGTPPHALDLQRAVVLFAQSQPSGRITVVDRRFRVLADSRPGRAGSVLRDRGLEEALALRSVLVHGTGKERPFSLFHKSPLLFSAPLFFRGEKIGALRGELPVDDLRATLAGSQAMFFLYILCHAFLMIGLGSYLLSRTITRPLKRLVQMAERFGRGTLVSPAGPFGRDEMGQLFSSFSQMASRLRDDREKLNEHIRSLEQVNQELRRARDEVFRSERLASVGRLAAGVAHEVGNPTGAILGYLQLLARNDLSAGEKREVRQRAEGEAERIQRLVRELLDFSRPGAERREEVDLNAAIDRALALLLPQRKLWQRVRVIRELQPDLPRWWGDPHQFQQIMVNLLLNAADALEARWAGKNGTAEVRVTTAALSAGEASRLLETSGGAGSEANPPPVEGGIVLKVEVADTGPGIPVSDLGRIFDPFYSTKQPGEGTGLGLAICRRLIESYGGRILVSSRPGEGTAFTFLLPAMEKGHAPEKNSDRG